MANVVKKEIWINASVSEVFKCFTDSEAMMTWHGKEAELDPVPGGIYRVVFENGDEIKGTFKEIEENKRILYAAKYWDIPTEVEVMFEGKEEGTIVRIRQEFLPDQDISSFDHGWDYFLGILQKMKD